MKRLLFFLSFLSSAFMAQEPFDTSQIQVPVDGFHGDAHEYEMFISRLDAFNRKLGGCPKAGHLETCYAPNGVFDAKLWNELRRLAVRVFHLVPKNK